MADSLGEYLRNLRQESRQSLREVEDGTGLSNGYLSLLEHNKIKEPSPKGLYALAQHYEVPYLELMRLAGYPVPDAPGVGAPGVAFSGAERLTSEERRQIQNFISLMVRHRPDDTSGEDNP